MNDRDFTRSETRHVLLVDDHEPTLAAIAELLELERPGITVVGTAPNSSAAFRLARDTAPDVVVLDLELNGEDGLELIPHFVLKHGASVIILTSSNDPLKKRQGFAAGAKAFVSKQSPSEELITAILAMPARAEQRGGLSHGDRNHLPDE